MTLSAYTTSGEDLIFPYPIRSPRSPTTSDLIDSSGAPYRVGQEWINTATLTFYGYAGTGNWVSLGASAGTVLTVTGDTGGAISPVLGNITLAGTTNQITVTGSPGTETLSVPITFSAPGSITAVGNITTTTGNLVANAGNLALTGAGGKLSIHATTPTADSVGTTPAMAGTPGTITVATTACTVASIINYSRRLTGGTPGQVSISAQSAGSFTLLSTGNETSTFNYEIIN